MFLRRKLGSSLRGSCLETLTEIMICKTVSLQRAEQIHRMCIALSPVSVFSHPWLTVLLCSLPWAV